MLPMSSSEHAVVVTHGFLLLAAANDTYIDILWGKEADDEVKMPDLGNIMYLP